MRTINLGNQKVSVQGSPWALFIYQREFVNDEGKHADWYEDFDGNVVANEDLLLYVSPLFALKTCWAMARNHDDDIPGFDEWARPLEISMHPNASWIGEVVDAIFAELFRISEEEDQKDRGTTKPKRKCASGGNTDPRS